MKKKNFMLALVLFSVTLCAQNSSADSLSTVQDEMQSLKQSQTNLESQIQALGLRLNSLEKNYTTLNKKSTSNTENIAVLSTQIVSLNEQVGVNTSAISANAESFGTQLNFTTDSVHKNASKIHSSIVWGSIVIALVLILSVLLTLLLRRKGANEINDLKKQANDINQKIVDKLSNEVSELQKIADTLSNQGDESKEHDLVIALADRITFMEMTLYKMDSHIRGYSHLSKTLAQMKNNLQAYGYVVVDMLGKEYVEGLKATVNYNDDPNIEPGKQIITNIIKPQINYKGTMIQSAQITVSQNI